MNKQEIIKELETVINDHNILELVADRLYKIMSKVNKPVQRWRAKNGDRYFFVNGGVICPAGECGFEYDYYCYGSGNYFETEQEAIDYKRQILIRQQIADIALELNDGKVIDWKKGNMAKYYLAVDTKDDCLCQNYMSMRFSPETIYCLSSNFLETVKERLTDNDFEFYYGVKK